MVHGSKIILAYTRRIETNAETSWFATNIGEIQGNARLSSSHSAFGSSTRADPNGSSNRTAFCKRFFQRSFRPVLCQCWSSNDTSAKYMILRRLLRRLPEAGSSSRSTYSRRMMGIAGPVFQCGRRNSPFMRLHPNTRNHAAYVPAGTFCRRSIRHIWTLAKVVGLAWKAFERLIRRRHPFQLPDQKADQS